MAIGLVIVAMVVRAAFLPAFNSQVAVAAPFDAPFRLIDQDGRPFTSDMLADRPHAFFFGYTSCPDICPTTLVALARWIDEAHTSRSAYVFVTVDPERDKPDVLKSYLAAFSPRLIGLTGGTEDVSKMLDAYHIFRERVPEPGGSYSMNHTATIFLVNSQGKLLDTIAHDEPEQSAVAKLKRLDGT